MASGEVKLSCKEHTLKDHDVFINYRVATNADTAQALFLTLAAIERSDGKRVTAYLDRYCLEEGRPWEEGFLVGISNAALIVLLISEDAIAGIKDADKWQDNVLLEYEYALEKVEKNEAHLLPVFLGKKVPGATPREILWKDFGAFDTSVFPDAPHKKSGKNVRTTMQALFKIQGLQVTKADAVPSQKKLFKKKIEAALAALKRLGPTKAKAAPPAYLTKAVPEWTVDDVKAWLLGSGLKDYEPAFTENAIDGKVLATLSEAELKSDLKVTKPLIVRKILNMVKEANANVEKLKAAEVKKAAAKEKKVKEPAEGEEAEEGEKKEAGEEEEEEEEEEPEDEPADEEEEDEAEEAEKPKLGATVKVPTHKDTLVYKKVNKIAGYQKGWNCDECRASHKPKEPSYHCDKHNYDLCIDCSKEEPEEETAADGGDAGGGAAGGGEAADAGGDDAADGGDGGGDE